MLPNVRHTCDYRQLGEARGAPQVLPFPGYRIYHIERGYIAYEVRVWCWCVGGPALTHTDRNASEKILPFLRYMTSANTEFRSLALHLH